MSIRLNISDLLGNQNRGNASADDIIQIIENRLRFKADYEGASVIVEPYALVNSHGNDLVSGVVIHSDSQRYLSFEPRYLEVGKLSDVVALDAFFPNGAFDAEDFPEGTEILAAVELVDYAEAVKN